LIDLLLISRHLTPSSNSLNAAGASGQGTASDHERSPKSISKPVPLASSVLDTLLCVLVDSSPALRIFEDANGVQVVVKILKRANTPREVRLVEIRRPSICGDTDVALQHEVP